MATFIEDYSALALNTGTQVSSNKPQPSPVTSDRPKDDPIFDDLLVSGAKPSRNRWATAAGLSIELLLLSVLAIVPLYRTDPLPVRQTLTPLYLQPPAAAAPIFRKFAAPKPSETSSYSPTKVRDLAPLRHMQEASSPVQAPGVVGAVPGGVEGGVPSGVIAGVVGGATVPIPARTSEVTPVRRIRVSSHIAETNLIHEVPPQYPLEAGRARIEGTVVLIALIGIDGTVKDVRVESGLPLLAQAAIEAVKQWQYKPYVVGGQPVEIDSRITINFTMARG